jgi:3-hydroxyisobutyrate dehydrogenase
MARAACAVEIMLNTPLISRPDLQGRGGRDQGDHEAQPRTGHADLRPGLFDAYEANLITYEDALRNADSVNDLRLQIKLQAKRAKEHDLSAGTEHLPSSDGACCPAGTVACSLEWLHEHHDQRPPLRPHPRPPRGLSRPGRDGLPHGRPPGARRAHAGHGLQPHRYQGRKPGRTNWRARPHAPPPPRASGAAGADFVFACVGNDDDLRAVVLGEDGAFAGMAPGASSSTTPRPRPSGARAARRGAHRGLHFIDAPVSGGQAGAQNGQLTVMCGGDAGRLRSRAGRWPWPSRAPSRCMGPSGAGQLAKMVNQICIAGLVQGLSEAIAFGQRAGLDMQQVLDVIGKGAAQSWQMDNRGKTMVAGQVRLRLRRRLDAQGPGPGAGRGPRNGARLPVTALVDQFYADVQQQGGGRWDTSSLVRRLK